jgi:hypothetical protein
MTSREGFVHMVLAGHMSAAVAGSSIISFGSLGIEQVYQAVLVERLGQHRRRFADIEAPALRTAGPRGCPACR